MANLKQVEEFVDKYRESELPLDYKDQEKFRPFLSIITRTEGKRPELLRDVILMLAGQTCESFEHVIVIHNPTEQTAIETRRIVQTFPAEVEARTKIITCNRPGRSAPLNDAWSQCRGEYIAVLDDDDFVFSHYVETFQLEAKKAPGRVLRATCTRQDYEATTASDGKVRPRATSWFKSEWPNSYDPVNHLYENFTPFMSVAFPRDAANRLKLTFDEALSTAEDWDFTTQLAIACGVQASGEITSIYRWWTNGYSSTFLHDRQEWIRNHDYVIEKFNGRHILLPPGSAGIIANLYKERHDIRAEMSHTRQSLDNCLIERESLQRVIAESDLRIRREQQRSVVLARALSNSRYIRNAELQYMRTLDRTERGDNFRTNLMLNVISSGLFNPIWYLETYPDVAASGLDPLEHFIDYGIAECRNPGPAFDSAAYIKELLTDESRDAIPFLHYLEGGSVGHGQFAPARLRLAADVIDSGLFDERWYLAANDDVACAGKDALAHFIDYGISERRDPGPYFNSSSYLNINPDVADAGIPPFLHFLRYGIYEGREIA